MVNRSLPKLKSSMIHGMNCTSSRSMSHRNISFLVILVYKNFMELQKNTTFLTFKQYLLAFLKSRLKIPGCGSINAYAKMTLRKNGFEETFFLQRRSSWSEMQDLRAMTHQERQSNPLHQSWQSPASSSNALETKAQMPISKSHVRYSSYLVL